MCTLKFIYSEKETQFEEIPQKEEGDFVKFLWPSQKTSTLCDIVGVTFLPTFFERKAPKVETLLFEHKV